MRATFVGEVRTIRASEDGKYKDVAVLQEGAANSTRLWSYADLEGLGAVQEGDTVECDVYAAAKIAKTSGNPYLSVQLRAIRVQSVAGEKFPKAV